MEKLEQFRTKVDDIRYVDIVAEEDEDAYTIFEILNARGQVLTDFELLRNYLISHATSNEKGSAKEALDRIKDLLGTDVEMFLKHYVMHKLGKKTDKEENRPYKVLVRSVKGKNTTELLNDLLLKSQYYKRIISFTDCSDLEKKIFSFFKPRRQQQFRPLVIGMMHQKDLGRLSQATYDEYLTFLYEFFICYHVIGEQTSNKIEDIVYAYSPQIENNFSDSVLDRFRASMIRRIPGEKAFKAAIKNIRYSHKWDAYADNRKRQNASAIFEVIERELGYTGSFDDVTIEHCRPDADSEDNSVIGNLMLLEKTLNEDCGTKSITEKATIYKKSALMIPQKVAEESPTDDAFSADERSNWLAETLYKYITKIKEMTPA